MQNEADKMALDCVIFVSAEGTIQPGSDADLIIWRPADQRKPITIVNEKVLLHPLFLPPPILPFHSILHLGFTEGRALTYL